MVGNALKILVLCLIAGLLPIIALQSQVLVVPIDESMGRFVNLRSDLKVLHDPNLEYAVQDFIESDFSQFHEIDSQQFEGVEFPLHAWKYFEVQNKTGSFKNLVLIGCMCADSLVLHEVTGGKVTRRTVSGNAVPPKDDELPFYNSFIPLSLEANQTKKILIRAYYGSSRPIDNLSIVSIWRAKDLFKEKTSILFSISLYSGIMIVFALLGFVAFRLFREKVFAYFGLMSVSFMLYFAHQLKLTANLVYFDSYQSFYTFHTFSIALMLVVTYFFIEAYVKLHKYLPGYNIFYKAFTILFALFWLVPHEYYLTPGVRITPFTNSLLLFWLGASLFPVILLALKGDKASRNLLLATSFMVGGFAFYIISILSSFRVEVIGWNIILSGTICFFALLIYGLFEKVRQIVREKQELSNLSKLKSRFFANISHEFRTPLTLIMGPTSQLLKEEKDPSKKRMLGTTLKYSKKLLSMVNDLLELSRADDYDSSLSVSKGNVDTFVKGIAMSFESLAEAKNIELSYFSEIKNPELWFDPEKMEAIVGNLMSNAFKFTQEGGNISVVLKERSREVSIEIRDTGIGIPSEKLPYIFDRFFQADELEDNGMEGSGIGLSLVKEFVTKHKGTIEVDSKVGQGTTFLVKFLKGRDHFDENEISTEDPVATKEFFKRRWDEDPEEDIPERQESPDHPAALTPGTVALPTLLIVEDNPDVRHYVREQFEGNYSIIEAQNGEEGIEKAIQHLPHLIISDVMMPKKNGFEVCSTLKKDVNTSHIPIILLTAKSDHEARLEGLEYGADDYITKPFNSKELELRVRNLIETRNIIQQKILKSPALAYNGVKTSPVEREFLQKVSKSIEENIDNQQFGVPFLAREVGLSQTQLNRKLKSLANLTAGKYIQHIRLNQALDLLKGGKYNVSEVALMTGFNSNAYFVKTFREQFGETPGAIAQK